MNRVLRFAPILALAALLAGCQGPCEKIDPITMSAPPLTGDADFTRYVSAGTSLTAGYQSGGLVDRHQVHGYAAIFARQVGMTVELGGRGSFALPTVNGNGLPALLQLRSLSPLVISSDGLDNGTPTNLEYPAPYGNLGVPGAIMYDFANTGRYGSGYFPLIARNLGSIQDQVIAEHPTFVSLEFGINEVLGPAASGTSTQSPVTNPGAFTGLLTAAVDAIHTGAPGAKVALCNVPDVTSIPFFTTFPPYTVQLANGQPITLVGPGGAPLAPTDLVLLTAVDSLAAGTGFPVGSYNYVNPQAPGNGRPLLPEYVLDGSEQTSLENDIVQMNSAIDSIGHRPYVAVVDINGALGSLASNGITIGATHYTTAYVSGGLFSLDGVHPNDLGHAITANAMIDGVNARFGTNVAHVDVASYATATASSARPVRPEAGGSSVPTRIDGLAARLRALYGR
jgi:lysophospholipase L1-like esterase